MWVRANFKKKLKNKIRVNWINKNEDKIKFSGVWLLRKNTFSNRLSIILEYVSNILIIMANNFFHTIFVKKKCEIDHDFSSHTRKSGQNLNLTLIRISVRCDLCEIESVRKNVWDLMLRHNYAQCALHINFAIFTTFVVK